MNGNMLKFKLIWKRENEIAYEYFPEGGTDAGVIIYNIQLKEFRMGKIAQTDVAKTYAGMMASRIREFAKTNLFKPSGIIAWC